MDLKSDVSRGAASGLSTPPAANRPRRWELPALIAGALVVRVAAFLAFPGINHPDEIFQLLEPAHRIAFGYGIATWEFRDGIRSMIPPYLLAALFAASEPILGGPTGYLRFTWLVLAAVSCIPIAFIWRMARRVSPVHALIAGVVAATWFDLVYFSFRPLTEALACEFILTALALCSAPAGRRSPRALAGVGACLALAVMLRPQLAPGAVLIWFVTARAGPWTYWRPMTLAAAPIVAVFGAVDWLTWGAPFASYVQAMTVNLVEGRASLFGVEPWFWYLQMIWALWAPWTPLLVIPAVAAVRRWGLWIGFAATEIAVHSLIPHKEYRFIYPALATFVVAAALGSADLVQAFGARFPLAPPGWLGAALAATWVWASATLGLGSSHRFLWNLGGGTFTASAWLADRRDLCGVLFYDNGWTGGYVSLHRNVPLYSPDYIALPRAADRRDAARRASAAYDYVVLARSSLSDFPSGWRSGPCFVDAGGRETCVIGRPGGCKADPMLPTISSRPGLGDPSPRAANGDRVAG